MKIKSALKSDFCTFFFLIYLVGMVISIEHTICKVLTITIIDEIVLKTRYVL